MTLRCNDINSLPRVHGSDAVFSTSSAPRVEAIANGSLVELPITPALNGAHAFAFVTLAGTALKRACHGNFASL